MSAVAGDVRRWAPILALLGCLACGSASPADNQSGGDSDAASPSADGGACDTWSCLYADYFGSSGVASCAGDGSCHGSTSQPGYATSMFLCPPNDPDGCYAGITSLSAGLLPSGESFGSTPLYVNLRKTTGGGTMPKSPAYSFSATDLQRVSNWVAGGAKND